MKRWQPLRPLREMLKRRKESEVRLQGSTNRRKCRVKGENEGVERTSC